MIYGLRGVWGLIRVSAKRDGLSWEPAEVEERELMSSMLSILRLEFEGDWQTRVLDYQPDPVGDAAREAAFHYGGEAFLIEDDEPLPPGTVF